MEKFIGSHIIADCNDCNSLFLNDIEYLKDIMGYSIILSNANILGICQHSFTPQGVTILFLLSESHLSIHSYPEYNYCAIDFFTCGEQCNPLSGIYYLIEKLECKNPNIKNIIRNVKT